MNEIRTRMLLTTAVFAAAAALLAGPANAYLDAEGGGAASVAVQPSVEPGTIPYLSHGIGVDETLYSAPSWATSQMGERPQGGGSSSVEPGTIPYLSHGIGVDETLYSAPSWATSQTGEQPSLGLTGDSALTRVSAPEPEGLTGDSVLTRADTFQANTRLASDDGFEWMWVGVGSGMAALLAAAALGLLAASRHRGRVALP